MENENKNSGLKIITGILAVLLVVAGAFAVKLYNQEKDTKSELTKEKEIVLTDLKQMVGKYDTVIKENNLKDTELNEARDRIQVLIDSVQKQDADISTLRKYRSEVFKLQKERDFLFAQNDSLKGMNRMLTMQRDSTRYELEVSQMKRDSLSTQREILEEKVALGSSLAANRLKATGVIVRNSGKLVENSNNRRVDQIRTCYTVPQNRITEAGDKMLYVKVLDPENNVLGENKTLQVNDSTSITYSTVSKFYYENTALDICENIPPNGDGFEEGTYKIYILDGANVIAESSMVLD
ncbi:hypothetical protein [Flavimarina sp. Hel_I_48]|uniref:hypothetical protein n=1 Tax=Flavimarina sp. Hel_I_48 TaxID=1392488 RepID=UPI0004DF4227|nr:hypothetical protein [Flavimarina sp. Hel_I_48]